jgi:hypothetical protein
MFGVGLRAWAIFGLGLAGICGCGQAGNTRSASGAQSAPATRAPVYRYLSLGVNNSLNQRALEAGRIGVIADGGVREVVDVDGSVQLGADPEGENLMGAVPVPARLGGGFLFWGKALYRARSFTAPLDVITVLPTNAIGVEFGPNSLLLLQPHSAPRMFTLDPARSVQLSPKGVIDLAATDDGRALALDATGQALASIDAGKSWQVVTSAVGAAVHGLYQEQNEVAFVLKGGGSWLQRDGRLVQQPFKPENVPARVQEQRRLVLWGRAFSGGLPLPGARAWVNAGRGTAVVDLNSGSVSADKMLGSDTSSCTPVSLEDEGVVVCVNYAREAASTVVISHALTAAPVTEKTFAGTPRLSWGQSLSVAASCSGAPEQASACARHRGGAWVEFKVPAEVLQAWELLYWVPRETGGVVALVGAADGVDNEYKVGLFDPLTGKLTAWDTTQETLNPSQSFGEGSSLIVLAAGGLRGYTATRAIAVDAQGHVSSVSRSFASISSAGAHALARDDAENLWQTHDYGSHWQQIARPPFDAVPEGMAVKLDPRPSGRASRSYCSPIGCALEHSSGTGMWLRSGWPEDPARAQAGDDKAAPSKKRGPSAAPAWPEPVLPQLHCAAPTEGAVHVIASPRKPPEPKASGEWLDVLAGNRALWRRPPRMFANIAYRDLFATENSYARNGLRAAVHLEITGARLADLIEKKAPFELLFVEPFELNGTIRRVRTSMTGWSLPTVSAQATVGRESELFEFDQSQGAARPVLSDQPGRAQGVLLINGGLSFMASPSGKVRQVRPGCTPGSGYVDARGKAFVTCAKYDGSTQLEELAAPSRSLFRTPIAVHYRNTNNPGLRFLAPADAVFLNPDAIAVSGDGKLGILRLPPGELPSTLDNPAWLLSPDSAPIELAPWSTLEVATSPACANGAGVRAMVQTGKPWLEVVGTKPGRAGGMTALVRWGVERVCLEAVEVGYSAPQLNPQQSQPTNVSVLVRFVGPNPGAAFMGTDTSATVRESTRCELRVAAAP